MSANFVILTVLISFCAQKPLIHAQNQDFPDVFEYYHFPLNALSGTTIPFSAHTISALPPQTETTTLLNLNYSTTAMLSEVTAKENATVYINVTTVKSNYTDFPQPWNSFQTMIDKAKEFANRYMTKQKIRELKIRVQEARDNGANLKEIRGVVLKYLNSVLTPQQKREIRQRKQELEEEFSDAHFYSD